MLKAYLARFFTALFPVGCDVSDQFIFYDFTLASHENPKRFGSID